MEALSFGWSRRHKDFLALDQLDLTISKGETVGIIGRNGSGKSTLLKLITGLLQPTEGTLRVDGKVSALLELGAGFNPELTGLENVWLNATILGYEKSEVQRKLPGILAFADIGDFIHQKVKVYSSGMFARLAFAVAINLEPEILIVDEILAVGDVLFQSKCFRKFEELKKNGTTILFVTHSVEQIVSHCDRAILLHDGRKLLDGDPRDVANAYLDLMFGRGRQTGEERDPGGVERSLIEVDSHERFAERPGYNKDEYRWGDRSATILDYRISVGGEAFPAQIDALAETTITFAVRFNVPVRNPVYGLLIKTVEGVFVYGTNSRIAGARVMEERRFDIGDVDQVAFSLRFRLARGNYLLSVGVSEERGGELEPLDRRYDSILVSVHNPVEVWGLADLGAGYFRAGEEVG